MRIISAVVLTSWERPRLGVPRGTAAFPALALIQHEFDPPAAEGGGYIHPIPMNPFLVSLRVGVGVGVVRGCGRQIGIVLRTVESILQRDISSDPCQRARGAIRRRSAAVVCRDESPFPPSRGRGPRCVARTAFVVKVWYMVLLVCGMVWYALHISLVLSLLHTAPPPPRPPSHRVARRPARRRAPPARPGAAADAAVALEFAGRCRHPTTPARRRAGHARRPRV